MVSNKIMIYDKNDNKWYMIQIDQEGWTCSFKEGKNSFIFRVLVNTRL